MVIDCYPDPAGPDLIDLITSRAPRAAPEFRDASGGCLYELSAVTSAHLDLGQVIEKKSYLPKVRAACLPWAGVVFDTTR